MQTASTNICERMARSQELSEFQRGTVMGRHLCSKSSWEISSVSCRWCYNKVEAIGNDSSSAMKWSATESKINYRAVHSPEFFIIQLKCVENLCFQHYALHICGVI